MCIKVLFNFIERKKLKKKLKCKNCVKLCFVFVCVSIQKLKKPFSKIKKKNLWLDFFFGCWLFLLSLMSLSLFLSDMHSEKNKKIKSERKLNLSYVNKIQKHWYVLFVFYFFFSFFVISSGVIWIQFGISKKKKFIFDGPKNRISLCVFFFFYLAIIILPLYFSYQLRIT